MKFVQNVNGDFAQVVTKQKNGIQLVSSTALKKLFLLPIGEFFFRQNLNLLSNIEECCQLKNKERLYEAVMPLRLIKEAINETEVWKKLTELEDHLENRMNSEDWMFFHEKVIQDLHIHEIK